MSVQVVWLKRDLRLRDHAPLQSAIISGQPVLLLYFFEPVLLNHDHYAARHFAFVQQSLDDLDEQLKPYNTKVLRLGSEAIDVLSKLHQRLNMSFRKCSGHERLKEYRPPGYMQRAADLFKT
jgi:deoxyribodipyrimidine photo-lyase